MSQKESKLSRDIMDELRLHGWFCFKVHGNEATMKGLPDIMVCAEGYFIALETKRPSEAGASSVKQEQVQSQINDAGGYSQVVITVRQAVYVVEQVIARANAEGRVP